MQILNLDMLDKSSKGHSHSASLRSCLTLFGRITVGETVRTPAIFIYVVHGFKIAPCTRLLAYFTPIKMQGALPNGVRITEATCGERPQGGSASRMIVSELTKCLKPAPRLRL